MEVNEIKVKELNENQNRWKKNREQEQVDFNKIMEGTVREKEQVVAKTVVKLIKEENLLRDTVEKR